MGNIPRRNISELFYLYELEPLIADVFVEGAFDVAFIRRFLNQNEIRHVNVYEISTIEVDEEELILSGRKANNRDRTIWLSEQFEKIGLQSNQLTCIADKDFCHHLGLCSESRSLIYSDFSCMEMYFFETNLIESFLNTYCYKEGWPCDKILSSLSSCLQRMYLIRLAIEVLNWQIGMLDKIACIDVENWEIKFDEREYVKRILNKNKKLKNLNELLGCIKQCEKKMLDDPRHQMHGHDFINLFCYMLKRNGIQKEILNAKLVPRILLLISSKEYLSQFSLFDLLINRIDLLN